MTPSRASSSPYRPAAACRLRLLPLPPPSRALHPHQCAFHSWDGRANTAGEREGGGIEVEIEKQATPYVLERTAASSCLTCCSALSRVCRKTRFKP